MAIDEALKENRVYAENFKHKTLSSPPAKKVAILACMDARLTIEPMLGLQTGDAHIIRNAGGIATEDALRSLIISQHLLGTREIMVINHTDCGMLTFRDDELERKLIEQTGQASILPARFHSFTKLEENVRNQVQKIRSHPWVLKEVPVRGFIYDVRTGKLAEIDTTQAILKAA